MEDMQILWMDFPHQWGPFLLLATVWRRCIFECSYYIFQMSYSSTPVWKSTLYQEGSVTEATRRTDSTKVPEVRGLSDKKLLCPSEAVLDQDADGSRGQNPRGVAESVSSRKILSGNWKIGLPHPDCLNKDAWKKVRVGKLPPKWWIELWAQNYKL